MELPDPSNPLQRWIADTAAGFRQLQATAGPGDGDVNFAQIVALSKKVAEGYVFLYEEGHICNVLRDDSNNRCRHIEERTKEHPEESIGTLSDLAKHELARIGTEGVRRGSNTNDALWILRIFRFVLKLFTYLQEPGFSVGTAARYTFGEVLAPYYSWMLSLVAKMALSLAPSRHSLLSKANLAHGPAEEQTAIRLIKQLCEAVQPVVTRLDKFFKDNDLDFDDKV